jgi:hypothetical protein
VEGESQTVELGLQLGASALMVLLMTIVHGLGLIGISKVLNLKDDRLKELDFNFRAISLMCGMALLLFALHLLEIWIFAAFYLLVSAIARPHRRLFPGRLAADRRARSADRLPADRLVDRLHRQQHQQAPKIAPQHRTSYMSRACEPKAKQSICCGKAGSPPR